MPRVTSASIRRNDVWREKPIGERWRPRRIISLLYKVVIVVVMSMKSTGWTSRYQSCWWKNGKKSGKAVDIARKCVELRRRASIIVTVATETSKIWIGMNKRTRLPFWDGTVAQSSSEKIERELGEHKSLCWPGEKKIVNIKDWEKFYRWGVRREPHTFLYW